MNARSLSLAAAVVTALVAPAAAEDVRKTYHETFPAPPGTVLNLRHGDGDVDISVWDRDEIEVQVEYHEKVTKAGVGEATEFEVRFRVEDDTVYVSEHGGSLVFFGFVSSNTLVHRYEIRLPAHVDVETRGDDGDLHVAGLRGDLECTLNDGDVSLEDLESRRVRVVIEDGDLDAGRLTGDVVILSEDGDVTVDECGAGKLFVQTEDGDVDVHLARSDETDVQIEVQDGSVELRLDEGLSAAFLVTTEDGDFQLEHPDVKRFDRGERGAYGEIGDGEGSIRVRTEDGSVTIRGA